MPTMNKPKNKSEDYVIVPIDEEQERAEAIVNWIVETLDRAGKLSGLYSEISAQQRTPKEVQYPQEPRNFS